MSWMRYFERVVGQDEAVALLIRTLSSGRLQQGYLFRGPEGVGRLTTAICFAGALLGLHYEKALRSPYLLILRRSGATLGIDRIRDELIPFFALRVADLWRVAVVVNAESMTQEAQNALLKTLEEPPARCCIILITSRMTLLPTVISRCAVVRFKALGKDDLKRLLMREGVDVNRADEAAELSSGSVKTARFLLTEDLIEPTRNIVESVLNGDAVFGIMESVIGRLKREEVIYYLDILFPLLLKGCGDIWRRQVLAERTMELRRAVEQSANIKLALAAFATVVEKSR